MVYRGPTHTNTRKENGDNEEEEEEKAGDKDLSQLLCYLSC